MIRLTADQLARWRAEIDLGVEHRDKEFGTYRQEKFGQAPTTTLAGENLDYYEQGAERDYEGYSRRPLNIVFPLVKNVVPTLFYQNPRATAAPVGQRTLHAGDDAFYVSEFINADLKDIDFRFKETSQLAVFDSFVLGYGVVKIGYSTEFGPDILPTKAETKKKFRERVQDFAKEVLQGAGIVPPPAPIEPEPQQVQPDSTIMSESPYIQYISPFDFVIDPRARDLTDAQWVAQRIRRTLESVRADRRYGAGKHELAPEAVDDDRISDSFVEAFQTVDVWEVHYKDLDSPTGITVLTFATTQTQTKALLHDHSAYDIGGWQYEWLAPNKHGHRLYPVSVLSVMRPLIDRLNGTFDAILEQIDKFQVKIAHNERVEKEGISALKSNTLGAVVKVTGRDDVRGAVQVISMQQVASDMMSFVNSVMDLLLVIVGVTRAQFTGITQAQTATEAQIGQGGQNLRRTDEGNTVGMWSNRVVAKLWRVKAQFQDLVELEMTQDTPSLDTQSGMQQTQWFPPIDQERADRLKRNKYKISLEVSSIQKPNLEILRAQFEQFVRALMEPVVTNGLAMEGKRLSPSEIIRQWSRFFSEGGLTDVNKMVVPVTDPNQQAALLGFGQKPGPGGQNGAAAQGRSLAGAVPTFADQVSAVAGEKGQGASPV